MDGHAPGPEAFLAARDVVNPELLATLKRVHAQAGSLLDEPEEAETLDPNRSPRRFGDFRILRTLGSGGMGVVYLAEQLSLSRLVALKVIRSNVGTSLAAAARFDREARAVARLRHPGIVTIHGVGEHRGVRFLAMEYVEGRGLDEILDEARRAGEVISPARALRWGVQLASALHAAHSQGVVHRDVKPSNIRITPDDRPMLLDFGLAREMGSHSPTLTEAFVGSPQYASPEQVGRRSGQIDARTDIYSLGAVLYEVLSGRAPIAGGTLEQVLNAVLTEEPPPVRAINPRVPREASVVVMKAISKDAARRYANAAELGDDLSSVLEFRPIRARPPGAVERLLQWISRRRAAAGAIATGLVAVIAISGFILWSGVKARAQREEEIDHLLESSRAVLRDFVVRRESLAALEWRFHELREKRETRYMTPDEDEEIDAVEHEVRRQRLERERMFYAALEGVSRAERLGASPERVERARAEFYFERHLDSAQSGDLVSRDLYRELMFAHDEDGLMRERLNALSTLDVVTDPPGVDVYLFRRTLASELYVGAPERRVLVPASATPTGLRLDALALRVVRGAGPVRAGDVILSLNERAVDESVWVLSDGGTLKRGDRLKSIDGAEVTGEHKARMLGAAPNSGTPRVFVFERNGGEIQIIAPDAATIPVELGDVRRLAESGECAATIWRSGAPTQVTLPLGLVVRTTAAPALLGPESHIGATPIAGHSMAPGDYLVVLSREGHEPARYRLTALPGDKHRLTPVLPRSHAPGDGWVFVPRVGGDGQDLSFYIMEHEVTCRQYFEFLNDPAVRSSAGASAGALLYPRDNETARGDRDAEGKFTLPQGWQWDWPVFFISWHDARTYAKWYSTRADPQEQRFEFDLPTREEWVTAGGAAQGDSFVFGPKFRFKWVSSCYARPRPDPEPVLSFPIDESVFGVFDMSGSISEWSSTRWREGTEYMQYCCGAWGLGKVEDFRLWAGNGALPDRVSGSIGFRLVARPLRGRP